MKAVPSISRRKPPACACEHCQALCHRNPGIFSVDEARAAIDAGFGPDRMMICSRFTTDGRDVLKARERYDRARDDACDEWGAEAALAMLLAWAKAHKIPKRRFA